MNENEKKMNSFSHKKNWENDEGRKEGRKDGRKERKKETIERKWPLFLHPPLLSYKRKDLL